jgi:hypothetical protein
VIVVLIAAMVIGVGNLVVIRANAWRKRHATRHFVPSTKDYSMKPTPRNTVP